MTKLGGSVDELELDLLLSPALGIDEDTLAESNGALLDARDAALDHDEVLLDDTEVREATHGSDGLLGEIEFSSTRSFR